MYGWRDECRETGTEARSHALVLFGKRVRQSNEPKERAGERAGGRSCPVSWDAQREAEVEACIGEEASEYNIVN